MFAGLERRVEVVWRVRGVKASGICADSVDMSRAAPHHSQRVGPTLATRLRQGPGASLSSQLERAIELTKVIESAGDAVISISSAGLIESWNESAERLYGYSEAEALGQSLAIITPPHRADEPPAWVRGCGRANGWNASRLNGSPRTGGFSTSCCRRHRSWTATARSLALWGSIGT